MTEKKKVAKKKSESLIERPKIHSKPRPRYYGVDEFRARGVRVSQEPIRYGEYRTDRECIEAGDISACPVLFEG